MKSFSEFIKYEILNNKWTEEQTKVLLLCYIKHNSKIDKDNVIIKFSVVEMIEQFHKLLKKCFKNYNFEIKKNSIITSGFDFENPIKPSLLLDNEDLSKAYIAGLFLSKGSCSNPLSSNYHLELRIKTLSEALDIVELLTILDFKPKQFSKNNWYYIYFKSSMVISDFLKMINATQSVLLYEKEKISKDFISSTKKLEALEEVNFKKTDTASKKYIALIKKIKTNKAVWATIKQEQKQLYQMRVEQPMYTLEDLRLFYNSTYGTDYSKSTINIWLRKLFNYA